MPRNFSGTSVWVSSRTFALKLYSIQDRRLHRSVRSRSGQSLPTAAVEVYGEIFSTRAIDAPPSHTLVITRHVVIRSRFDHKLHSALGWQRFTMMITAEVSVGPFVLFREDV